MVIETERGVLDTIRGLGGFLGTARVVSEGMGSLVGTAGIVLEATEGSLVLPGY